MHDLKCVICGKRFLGNSPNVKVCSPKCRDIHEANKREQKNERERIKYRLKKRQMEDKKALEETAVKARHSGLSYGEYTAIKRAGALYIRGKLWVYDPALDVVSITKDHSE